MKKLLLASTALVLSAGLANAQALNITGEGRMGIVAANGGGGWAWSVENRLTLNFNVSVEGDHGLTFGAWMRARTSGFGGLNQLSGSRVWVEANGLRLPFGNQDGAIRGAGTIGYAGGCSVGYVGGNICGDTAGLIGISHGQNSTGPGATQRVGLSYTMGDVRAQLSHDRGGETEIGVTGSFDAFTVAAGYSTVGTGVWTVSGRYNGGSWTVGALIAADTATTNWRINGTVALGGGDLYAYVGDVNGNNAYGLSYGYGLGGGATMTAGWETVGVLDTLTLGVSFGF